MSNSGLKRLAKVSLVSGLLLIGMGLGSAVALSEPLPEGQIGPEAEALTDRLEQAVGVAAWTDTGAVEWTFAGGHEHLWDRERGLARVRFNGHEVLVDLGKQQGRAWKGDKELQGRKAERLVAKAYSYWVNDSFWLNPVAKLRDDGVQRSLVTLDSGDALLVSYSSGGLTPGDAYLWHFGPDGRPSSWQMWVKVIPMGGVSASWEGWTQLETGAWVSTEHSMGPVTLEITQVSAATSLSELESPDPFLPLSP